MLKMEDLLQLIESDLSGAFALTNEGSNHLPKGEGGESLEVWQAHAYPLAAGGKRIRPLLLLLMAGALGGEKALDRARVGALSIELIHSYSLVHDDLPCMDNDDFRRGKPTTHKVFGEAKALLVGDGLCAHAFTVLGMRGNCPPWSRPLLSDKEAADLCGTLGMASGPSGMVNGQWIDISMTATFPQGGSDTPILPTETTSKFKTLESMHVLKTGKLLGASLEMGCIVGLAERNTLSGSEVERARSLAKELGELIGLTFQIIDDILDATQSSAVLGKSAGKDAAAGKLTAVSLLGVDEARTLADSLTLRASELLEIFLAEFSINDESNQSAFLFSQSAQSLIKEICNQLLNRSH
jgi:geranylgeranyl pyrophosphate synthase